MNQQPEIPRKCIKCPLFEGISYKGGTIIYPYCHTDGVYRPIKEGYKCPKTHIKI